MDSSPSPRPRSHETTPGIAVVTEGQCQCDGCNHCDALGQTFCPNALVYHGRGRSPRYCDWCRSGGAAKKEWERKQGEELQRIRRVEQALCRARGDQASARASLTLIQFGGFENAKRTILKTGWAEHQIDGLLDCVAAVIHHYLSNDDALGAAPWFELHYDALRPRSNELATAKIEQTLDHLIIASRRKSIPSLIYEWLHHFLVLKCRRTLVALVPNLEELKKNVRVLERIERDGASSFVRSEAKIELASHHVELDPASPEVARRLARLHDLDPHFNNEADDWVIAASPLRPKINWAQKRGEPLVAKNEIIRYTQIVVPRRSFRQTQIAVELNRWAGRPLVVAPIELRYRPWIPPIGPFTKRDLLRWGVNDLPLFSGKRRKSSTH